MIDLAIKTHRHDGVLTQLIYLYQLFGFRRRWQDVLNLNEIAFNLGVATNGTTPVFFVNASSSHQTPTQFEVVGATSVALDTTAATITIKKNSTTICTITKSTTAGNMTGATSIVTTGAANQLNPGDILSAVSSSAGNSLVQVQILFPFN